MTGLISYSQQPCFKIGFRILRLRFNFIHNLSYCKVFTLNLLSKYLCYFPPKCILKIIIEVCFDYENQQIIIDNFVSIFLNVVVKL